MFKQGKHTISIMCPTQLRNIPVNEMSSERMLMPNWAKQAARVLSDQQLAAASTHKPDASALANTREATASVAADLQLDGCETVGGTVSRKGKFGFVCESCFFVPKKSAKPDWVSFKSHYAGKASVGLHFPHRCKRCASRMKRWTKAATKYDQLELLRILEGRHCLRFLTFTKEEWNVKVPIGEIGLEALGPSPLTLWGEAEKLKKMATRQFRNWRNRNKYWQSREAKGQCYYEVTMKPVWNGWGFDKVQLHFHIHMIVCSKRIENKDIQIDLDTLEPIPMSTTIQREWGGIVDVRKCRTWKHKDGEMKTSKRFVMNYLVDYINKSPHWQSVPFGDWSN